MRVHTSVYETLSVHMYLYPLVQCTYIGPTVHMHNFLVSFIQRAHYFPRSFRLLSCLRLGTSSFSPSLLTGCHTHISPCNLEWAVSAKDWADASTVFIPSWSQTAQQLLLVTTTLMLSSIWITALGMTKKIWELGNNTPEKVIQRFEHKFALWHSVLIRYGRDI